MTNLTAYEVTALKNIIDNCNDEDPETSTAHDYSQCFCEADTLTIAKACGISENQAKGVLGSLIKKGLAYQHDEDYGFMINVTVEGYEAYKSL